MNSRRQSTTESVSEMVRCAPSDQRSLRSERIDADLVVVGGGMAGTCCAITAARAGINVVLVQDRPVLGGNASSEFRLWMLGATSHMGNNNRWSREGGVVDEIMVENTFRNKEGNAVLFDTILLEKCVEEPRLTLLLNTAAFEVDKDGDRISCVRAFCSQNSTQYDLVAHGYCDASGDGILGFLAGAAFRMGAESRMEFGERMAPAESARHLLGHSLYFYSRDTGQPVKFVPPSYALEDITEIPRYRHFNTKEHGCQLWWIEWGGRLDTVHDTEAIKWELWKIVYGVWHHIKNSGDFPEAETMTLEWVGLIPGKRESRRFEGDYMLVQQDIVEQREHYDAVSFGGWAIDLHPLDGVYSQEDPCRQWHSKGVFQIPYRTMYSKNVDNLFLAGRIISASHVAFGSTRVMATCAHNAQAVGMAAALCVERQCQPRDLAHPDVVIHLQQRLLRTGQGIPGIRYEDSDNLCQQATIEASSALALTQLPATDAFVPLEQSYALLLPLEAGPVPPMSFTIQADEPTELEFQLRVASRSNGYTFTPDSILDTVHVPVLTSFPTTQGGNGSTHVGATHAGAAIDTAARAAVSHVGTAQKVATQTVAVRFSAQLPQDNYAYVCLVANGRVRVATSDAMLTGITTLVHAGDKRVSKAAVQSPPDDLGIESFEFWLPQRRPLGRNLAVHFESPVVTFKPELAINGYQRPSVRANAWIADIRDPRPTLRLIWPKPITLRAIELTFDTDLDHPMESVHLRHHEDVMPTCVREFSVFDSEGNVLFGDRENHQTHRRLTLDQPVRTSQIFVELAHPSASVPASLYAIRAYA